MQVLHASHVSHPYILPSPSVTSCTDSGEGKVSLLVLSNPKLFYHKLTPLCPAGLKRGELSLHQLAEQLRKTATFQSRHRDILATVIKLYQSQTG